MRIEFGSRAICLPDLDLRLDPIEDCARAWISHAHRDHARGVHREVFATPETVEMYKLQLSAAPRFHAVCCGRSFESGEARLTAYPAGHILGAAQLLIEWHGERVVYTGDIKLRPPLCGRPAQPVRCDRLIIESTFGLPVFRFLPREEARARIVGFAQACLERGDVPVFLAHPAGRGQEVTHVLCEAGIAVAVHPLTARLLPLYASCGFGAPGWVAYNGELVPGRAVVVPPGAEIRGPRTRLAYVSGWAALDSARTRTGAAELIPYSDHADFEELLAVVDQSGAREIDVVHGYAEAFAGALRDRGYAARAPSR